MKVDYINNTFFRELFKLVHTIGKKLMPAFVLNLIAEQRFYFLYKYAFDKKLEQQIKDSPTLSGKIVDDIQKKYNLKCRWAAVMVSFNDRPSKEYISEAFYYSQVLPRMNNLKFVKTYTDKNLYHRYTWGDLTPDVVIRKISGRYFNAVYDPIQEAEAKELIAHFDDDFVIKPAIESGSGVNVWVGSQKEAVRELALRHSEKDLVVQPRLRNHPSIAFFNPSSVNTFKIMTAFDGENYINIGGHLRMGRAGSYTDNRGSGGIAVGIQDDGAMCDFALGPGFEKLHEHPDHKIVFKGHRFERYPEIVDLCCSLHRYFPHFGMIGWDATIDHQAKIRIIELNISWHGIQVTQAAHGPLFGAHKDKLKKTYGIPDWES